jgi:hypothetical protein
MNRYPAAAVLVVLTLSAAHSVEAQSDQPSATVTGTLANAETGAPVRKAQVRLVQRTGVTLTTVTDPAGAFVFANVPAGEYMLKAWKPGYLDVVLGARRPGRYMPGTLLTIRAGQKLGGLALRIPPGGVISGVVRDEFGDPALNVPVRAMRVIYQNGRRSVYPSGNAATNDIGEYRIASLEPGDYYVAAVPRDSVTSVANTLYSLESARTRLGPARPQTDPQALRASIEDNLRVQGVVDPFTTVGYVATYFPGAVQPSAASTVPLGVSQHAGGIDIQLQPVESASVRGTVVTPDGKPASARVQLLDPAMPIAGVGVHFRNTDAKGQFSFAGLAPASYLVLTQKSQPGGAGELTASAAAHADAAGGDDVRLVLQPGVSVAGRLDLSTIPGVQPSKLRVRLVIIPGVDHWESPAIAITPDAEGQFVAHGVAPGQYRVVVSGLPAGRHIARAVFNGIDASDRNLVIERRENISGGVISFTSRVGEISGTVTDSVSDPVSELSVLLFPADRQLWVPESRRIRLAQPNPDGTFTIRDLPAGEYQIAAVPPPDAGQQFDVEYLAGLASGATGITLGEGERKTIDLRVR